MKKLRRSVKITWIISYFMVFLFQIVALFGVTFNLQASVDEQLKIQSELKIDNIMKSIDDEIKIYEMISAFFRQDPDVQRLVNIGTDLTQEDILLISNVSKTLEKFCNNYSVNFPIYLYLNKSDVIIAKDGIKQPFMFYKENYDVPDLSYSEWKNTIAMMMESPFKIASFTQNAKNGDYHQKNIQVSVVAENDTASCMLVTTKTNTAFMTSNDDKAQTFEYAILDRAGNVAYAGGKLNKFINKPIGDTLDIDGKHFVIAKRKAADFEYTYIVAVETYNLFVFFLPAILGLLCVMILSGMLLSVAINRNYRSLKEVIQDITGNILRVDEENEYELVRMFFKRMKTEKYEADNLLLKMKTQLQELYLKTLLQGGKNMSLDAKNKMEEYMDKTFLSDRFAITVIIVKDYEGLFEDDETTDEEMKAALVKTAVCNVINELVERTGNDAYIIEMKGYFVMLVSFARENANVAGAQLDDICNEFKEFMLLKLKIETEVTHSLIRNGVNYISEAYREALSLYGSAEMLKNNEENKDILTADVKRMLESYVNLNNPDAAKSIIETIAAEIYNEYQDDISMRKYMISELVFVVVNAVERNGIMPDKHDIFSRIFDSDNCEETVEILCGEVNKSLIDVKAGKENNLVASIKLYIENNFDNVDLNVNYVAHYFGMNRRYISELFTNQAGISILEYINQCRVNYAKTYLETTTLTTAEIYKLVGFSNDKTFFRIFKQYTNMTPTQYRNKLPVNA